MPLFVAIILSFATNMSILHAEQETETIKVYMTVTDITDVDDPYHIVADRLEVEVPYFELSEQSEYLFNPDGLLVPDSLAGEHKFTALHALVALHKMVYGQEDDLISKLYLDSNGDITLFFGKIAGTLLYQNNYGVFQKPQCAEIGYLDELNICLYNYGHNQQVAIFKELYTVVQRNENVTIHLEEYKEDPEDPVPLGNVNLTDAEGVYLTDTLGRIATTDDEGAATFSFSTGGVKRISIEPEIGYYLDTGTDEEKEIEYPGDAQNIEIRGEIRGRTKEEEEEISATFGDPQPMIKYTRPFANILVDDKFHLDVELLTAQDKTHMDFYATYRNTDTAKINGQLPQIRIGRFDQQGLLVGWLGDLHYSYTNTAGDTFSVDGDHVTCVATNCGAGSTLTILVYNTTVDSGAALDDSTIVYINQYEVSEAGDVTIQFNHRTFMGEGDYKVVINKNGVATSKIIHIYDRQAGYDDWTRVLPETIEERQSTLFQITSYLEDVDDDPSNDFIYKVFIWNGNDNWEPYYPPIVLYPTQLRKQMNSNK